MERLAVFITHFLLLMALNSSGAQLLIPVDINELDIQLANSSGSNEGRVLIRWPRDSTRTALCYNPDFADTIAFQMCRRLGYTFACGVGEAGPRRTDDSSLENVASVKYFTRCDPFPTSATSGGCALFRVPLLDPVNELACTHANDMWLSCGYAGMTDFELRLVEGNYQYPGDVLQGRCGVEYEWGAICNNWFHSLKAGRVACRELGYADSAISVWPATFDEVAVQHKPNYTLFVDTGCIGNETSLTECEYYSLRQCESYVTLECFTGITEYGNNAYLCGSKQLCGKRCKQQHPIAGSNNDDVFHYCRCDDVCVLFDDCCYDHEVMCSPEIQGLERGGFTADQFGCVWVPGSQFNHIGYVAVSHCPVSWEDEGTRDLCERPVDIEDVLGSLPVFDEQEVDFKNIYCAICNGRSLERLKRWDVSGSDNCRQSTAERFHPSLNQSLPSKGWVITPPQGHAVVRECGAHLVDTCIDTFRGTRMEEACRAYYAPIRTDMSHTRYRNPHCAMCNGWDLVPENSCQDQVCPTTCDPSPWGPCFGICSPYDDFFTIEVLFDLSSSSSITGVSCSEGQIYDPFLDRCRVFTCAAGHQIKGNECVVAPSIYPPIDASEDLLVTECLSERLGKNSTGTKALMASLLVIDTNASAWYIYVLVTSVRAALDIEIAFYEANINNNSLINSPLLCNISELSILLPFALDEFNYCSTDNQIQTLLGYNGTLLVVAKFKNTTGEWRYMNEIVSPLCLKIVDLNCSSLLTLEDSEYNILAKTNIELVATGTILSAAEHVLFPDGTAVVCSFIGPVPEGLEPQIRRAISFVGSLLSLLALTATFVTYCVFPELRNTAGKSTMNLVVALFIAILLFLLTGYLRQNHSACVFGAVIAHCSWLAAFSWMTLLCGNVARTMASKVYRPHRGTGIDRDLITFMSLAWGIPLVIVSICLILQYCDCTSLPVIYAEGDICWITDGTSRLVVFVVPVAVSLVINICLCVFTVISIRRNRQASKAARKQGKAEAVREELSIYAKMCALVGVTWVFGFISQSVTGILAFSYIYIILNYLQGVFIFIGFCLNKRVRGMWRSKLGLRRGRTGKESTSRPKQTAKTISTGMSTVGQPNAITEDTKL